MAFCVTVLIEDGSGVEWGGWLGDTLGRGGMKNARGRVEDAL